jgi:MFS family permease
MAWLADDIRATLWVAVVPAVLCVGVLAVFVREPEHVNDGRTVQAARLRLADARRLPSAYWLVVALGAMLALARFSEAFLVLRAQDVGLALTFVPIVMVVMNVVYAGLAYPAGAAADRVSPRALLLCGLVVLIAADVVLAFAQSPLVTLAGAALWGLHMALTQGLLAKLVADAAPIDLRGSAFGAFNLISGIAALGASVIAGALWSAFGPEATFLASAGFAVTAVAGFGLRGGGRSDMDSAGLSAHRRDRR